MFSREKDIAQYDSLYGAGYKSVSEIKKYINKTKFIDNIEYIS